MANLLRSRAGANSRRANKTKFVELGMKVQCRRKTRVPAKLSILARKPLRAVARKPRTLTMLSLRKGAGSPRYVLRYSLNEYKRTQSGPQKVEDEDEDAEEEKPKRKRAPAKAKNGAGEKSKAAPKKRASRKKKSSDEEDEASAEDFEDELAAVGDDFEDDELEEEEAPPKKRQVRADEVGRAMMLTNVQRAPTSKASAKASKPPSKKASKPVSRKKKQQEEIPEESEVEED